MAQRGEGESGQPGRPGQGAPQGADPYYQQQRDPFPEEAGEEEFYADSHNPYDMEMDPSYVEPSRSKLVPLLIAFVAMLGFAGILLYAYNLTVGTGMPDGEIPMVEAPAGAEKTRPSDRGGLEVPNQDKVFLNDAEEDNKQAGLLPPSEDPQMPTSDSMSSSSSGQSSSNSQGTATDVTMGSPPTLELSDSEPVKNDQGMENLIKDVDKSVDTKVDEVMAAVDSTSKSTAPPAMPTIPEPPKMSDGQSQMTSDVAKSEPAVDDVQGNMNKEMESQSPTVAATTMMTKDPESKSEAMPDTKTAEASKTDQPVQKQVESLLPKAEVATTPKTATPSSTSVAAVPAVPEPPKGSYIMQLAAVKSEAAAQSEWKRMQKKHKALLGAMPLLTQRADLGDRGIYFRIQTGPFPNKSTAQDLCLRLKQSGGDCIVKKR